VNVSQLITVTTMSYGPNTPLVESDTPHGPIPDIFPGTPVPTTHQRGLNANGGMTEGVRKQITRTLREFGFTHKGRARVYQKPYPEYFDVVPYPREFRVPDFTKFTSDDARTTCVHVGQFLA
jgi:hypothetical protein